MQFALNSSTVNSIIPVQISITYIVIRVASCSPVIIQRWKTGLTALSAKIKNSSVVMQFITFVRKSDSDSVDSYYYHHQTIFIITLYPVYDYS